MYLIKKIPKLDAVASVYAVIVVMLYYPTINRFFWNLPSWKLFMSIGDFISMYSYAVTVNFLESLLTLIALLGLSVLLPQKWFYDHFVSRGVSLVIFILGFFLYLSSKMLPGEPFPLGLIRHAPLFFVVISALVFLIDQFVFLRKVMEDISDRLVIFLYISIPVSVGGLVVVFVRNVF